MMKFKVIVSDHLLVRFLERVPGPHPTDAEGRIDIQAVREQILAEGREEAFELGARSVRFGDFVMFAKIDKKFKPGANIITTIHTAILDPGGKAKRTKVRW